MNQADDHVAWPDDAVEVGRIVDAWGIKGGIKVHPYSSDPQALFSSRRWYLQAPDRPVAAPSAAAAVKANGALRWPLLLRITEAKEQGDGVVALTRELPDRNAAEALKGARIFVPRSSFPTADDDEFYWVDLMGLSVVNRDGAALGVVADLLDTGAHSVLRVVDAGGKPGAEVERLIPFVGAFVDKVDLPGRLVTVDWSLEWDEPAPARRTDEAAQARAERAGKRRSKRAAQAAVDAAASGQDAPAQPAGPAGAVDDA